MGTPCDVAIVNPDGTVDAIYVNYDGYLSNIGPLLLGHYGERSVVTEMVALGHYSSLDETIASSVSYTRDRGEDDQEPEHFANVNEYRGINGSYRYLYGDDDIWYYESPTLGRITLTLAMAFLAKDEDFH
jgi:hypothetical protein